MDEQTGLSSPLFTEKRGFFARYDAWFRQSCPRRADKARETLRLGVRECRLSPGSVVARVPSAAGGWYLTELRWGGARTPVTPRGYVPVCTCPDFRPWCKHAMALAYHMAGRR